MLTKAGRPSLRMPPLIQLRMPAMRRALRSQKTVSRPKPARKNRADHLVPTARPRQTPAARRHHRMPSQGPASELERRGPPRGEAAACRRAGLPAAAGRRRGPSAGRRRRPGPRTSGRCPAARSGTCTRWWPSTASRSAGNGAQGQRAEELLRDQGQQEDRTASRSGPHRTASRRGCPPRTATCRRRSSTCPPAGGRRTRACPAGRRVAGVEGVVGLVRPAALVAADQDRNRRP